MIASTPRTPRPSQQRTAPALERQSTPCSPPPLSSAHALARACLWDGRVKIFRNRLNSMEIACSFSNPEFREVTNKK